MTNISDILEGAKDERSHYSPQDENSFLEWKFSQMQKIRIAAEESVTSGQIDSLSHIMVRMYFSSDLAERFPFLYAYEQTLFRYLNDKKEGLLVKPSLPD